MGLSTSSLWKRPDIGIRIIMLGLDSVGKTTILYKLQLGEILTTMPTIGFNVEHVEGKKGSIVEFTAWDVGGRCALRPLWRHYYKAANCAVFVVDSADTDRIEEAADELQRFLAEDGVREFPLLVFANKQDLPNAMRGPEVVDKLGLHNLRNRHWFLLESTALDGSGLDEGLEWLSRTLQHGQRPLAQTFPTLGTVVNKHVKGVDDGVSTADTDSTADTEALDNHA